MKNNNLVKIIGFVITCELIGSFGSIFTIPAIATWYKTLIKSPLNPPNWIFGPTWTILFALIGISAFLVFKNGLKKKEVKRAFYVFIAQFIVNILWSFLFFGLHSPLYGLIDIIILLTLILINAYQLAKINRLAFYFYLPYVLWVSFASYLNYSVYLLNK